VAEKGLE